MSVTIDIFFFFDMLVAFRTTYIDLFTGQEMSEPKLIAKNYLRGQFWIDLLATVPFDSFIELIIGEAGLLKVLGALKLVRVLRLSRMITFLRVNPESKAMLNLMLLVFYLVMYVHCFGCVWFMVASRNANWIPLFNYNSPDKWFEIYEQQNTH